MCARFLESKSNERLGFLHAQTAEPFVELRLWELNEKQDGIKTGAAAVRASRARCFT